MDDLDKFILETANTLGQEYNDSTFYGFVKKKLDQYVTSLNDNANIVECLLKQANQMNGKLSSVRFVNLIKTINKHCLYILAKSYKGDVWAAISRLRSLLGVQKYTDYKLVDMYANYLKVTIAVDQLLYRCVDHKSCESPDNCNHIPFNDRHKATKQRFNQLGVPCLYLSASLDCCQQEKGSNVDKDKKRWYGIFKPKKNLYFLDFSIPTEQDIKSMSDHDKFSFLVTYPLRLLCLTKTKYNGAVFMEEYLFSQLFFHIAFFGKYEEFPAFDGICYTSMKDRKALNYVIPAKYNNEEPPLEGISDFIQSVVDEIEVKEL